MQYTNEIEQIEEEILFKEELTPEENLPNLKADNIKKENNWLTIQLVSCIIIVLSVVLLKEFMPDLFEDVCLQYKTIIDETFLFEDGEYIIIEE